MKHFVQCPNCEEKFEIKYARTFACGSCPSVVHCDFIKCPECGQEFKKSQMKTFL
ncbi:MAG: hypothetical protein QW412_03845 [Candidatus Aenigmatarchaeota archaeon]